MSRTAVGLGSGLKGDTTCDNTLLDTQRKEDGEAIVTAVLFGDVYEELFNEQFPQTGVTDITSNNITSEAMPLCRI